MAKCDTCGNEYEPSLGIRYRGGEYNFDSFECAIQKLAPVCGHCGCRVIGHGFDKDGEIYCCESCSRHGSAQQAA